MKTPTSHRIEVLLDGLAAASILAPLSRSSPASAGLDERAIMRAVAKRFDRPGNPVMFGPVIVVGNCAIADWYQEEKGGRALLGRKDGNWSLRLCSGDSLKDPLVLVANGIARPDAIKLARELADAEARTSPEVDEKFSLFPGTEVLGHQD